MGLIDIASGNSIWRGIDYCNSKKIINIQKISENVYDSVVQGSGTNKYNVHMDVEHPRKSTCNCPHAFGRRVICKHIVATYFEIFPKELQKFLKEVEEYEKEEAAREEEEIEELKRYVNSLSKQELQDMLFNYMLEERYNQEREYW